MPQPLRNEPSPTPYFFEYPHQSVPHETRVWSPPIAWAAAFPPPEKARGKEMSSDYPIQPYLQLKTRRLNPKPNALKPKGTIIPKSPP